MGALIPCSGGVLGQVLEGCLTEFFKNLKNGFPLGLSTSTFWHFSYLKEIIGDVHESSRTRLCTRELFVMMENWK